jgi:hypothetical protein
MLKRIVLFLSFLILSTSVYAQKFANTISKEKDSASQPAQLENVKWLAGHWRGEAFGGITEEIWSPPLGGSMMCVFRSIKDNKVSFYELCTIVEENNTLLLRIKHFQPDLKGWEDKDVTVDFPLVKVTDNRLYFDDFTIEKVSPNEINMYVVIQNAGKESEVKFNYKRID